MVPDEEEFPRKCGQDDWAVKEVWEGRAPSEHKGDFLTFLQVDFVTYFWTIVFIRFYIVLEYHLL